MTEIFISCMAMREYFKTKQINPTFISADLGKCRVVEQKVTNYYHSDP